MSEGRDEDEGDDDVVGGSTDEIPPKPEEGPEADPEEEDLQEPEAKRMRLQTLSVVRHKARVGQIWRMRRTRMQDAFGVEISVTIASGGLKIESSCALM